MRWQRGAVMGAAGLLVLSLGVWLGVKWGAAAPPEAPTPSAPLAPEPTATSVPSSAPLPSASPPPRAPPPASPPPPTATAPGDTDEDEVRLPPLPTNQPDTRADRFEPQDGGEPEIRTILAVGDIRMGVVRDSQIRDQAGLNQVLVRIGGELERRMQSQQPKERGERAMQKLLDDYQEELGQYMNGEVELSGPGFTIGTEVGPPLPREKWWKPRPQ